MRSWGELRELSVTANVYDVLSVKLKMKHITNWAEKMYQNANGVMILDSPHFSSYILYKTFICKIVIYY